ncbi:hypothetical protein HKCCE4037_08705 [Rhodobacterales bacterium HKCCE4037]|nr:hypothetical protein [Rhodobacterales bacterium HKCCE4037]
MRFSRLIGTVLSAPILLGAGVAGAFEFDLSGAPEMIQPCASPVPSIEAHDDAMIAAGWVRVEPGSRADESAQALLIEALAIRAGLRGATPDERRTEFEDTVAFIAEEPQVSADQALYVNGDAVMRTFIFSAFEGTLSVFCSLATPELPGADTILDLPDAEVRGGPVAFYSAISTVSDTTDGGDIVLWRSDIPEAEGLDMSIRYGLEVSHTYQVPQ